MTERVIQTDEFLCGQATGPRWHYEPNTGDLAELVALTFDGNVPIADHIRSTSDGYFMARARNALPLYIAEVRRLQAENEALRLSLQKLEGFS